MPGVPDRLASRLDSLIGDGVEAAVKTKHRRRLRKLGWTRALNPDSSGLWARAGTPPRPGCRLEVLIDGANALPRVAEAIAGAQEYVHVTGWHLEPAFEIARGEHRAVVGALLAEMAQKVDVRVVVWAGAPVPVFHPTRSEVKQTVGNLVRGTKIRCEIDPREHPFHCHHEKTVIVDGTLAFVNGIDMTDMGGDRFDSSAHRARRQIGWHDVGSRLEGPAVADVANHFRMRWGELTGERLPAPPELGDAGEHTVQVVRTVSEVMYDEVPDGDFTILESYVRALRSAEKLIYLENQFLWAPEIVEILAAKLREPPHPDFRIVVVLPSKPNNGGDDTLGQLATLIRADDGGDRLLAATLRSRSGERADPLYVHAKVGIVDDRWLTVGSANLNAHSLLNDTEMNVVTDNAALARDTRLRLWSEHLELDRSAIDDADPCAVVDRHWRPIASEQLERQTSGAPPTHRLLALPGASRRSGRLLGPLQGLLDDG